MKPRSLLYTAYTDFVEDRPMTLKEWMEVRTAALNRIDHAREELVMANDTLNLAQAEINKIYQAMGK